jgi:hypothetical protein
MRRPKPKPQDTRLPRLRNATPAKRANGPVHDRRTSEDPVTQVSRGKNFRLRNLHPD